MRVISVNVGKPRPNTFGKAVTLTGIDKRPVEGPVLVTVPGSKGTGEVGLAGDRVYDVKHHGGPDQAVYAYAREDLDFWEAELTEVIIRLSNQTGTDEQRLLRDVRHWHHHVLARLGWIAEIEADARYLAESGARQLGPDHPDTLAWRELLATALWEGGRRDEARTEITSVAARRAAVLGGDHPDTLRTERIRAAMEAGPDDITFRLTDDL